MVSAATEKISPLALGSEMLITLCAELMLVLICSAEER
jgi:hypothetical protein